MTPEEEQYIVEQFSIQGFKNSTCMRLYIARFELTQEKYTPSVRVLFHQCE